MVLRWFIQIYRFNNRQLILFTIFLFFGLKFTVNMFLSCYKCLKYFWILLIVVNILVQKLYIFTHVMYFFNKSFLNTGEKPINTHALNLCCFQHLKKLKLIDSERSQGFNLRKINTLRNMWLRLGLEVTPAKKKSLFLLKRLRKKTKWVKLRRILKM